MAKLTGTVEKVFEHRKGKSESGKRWSVQRFILENDDEKVTCEAWGMRDLEDLEGEEVTVTGKMAKETYEGKTYERFKLDAPPKVGGTARSVRQDEGHDERDDPPPEKKDSWKVHLMRAANLLAKCHEAALHVGCEDGEDARTLFIEMKRYIKDLPAKPMHDPPEEEKPEPDLPMPKHKPEPDDYGPGPEDDDEIPF